MACPFGFSEFLCSPKASLLEHIQGLRSLFFFIEQPRTSKLFALPELQYVAALLSLASYTCWTRFSQSSRIARSVVLTNLPVNVEPDASSRQPPLLGLIHIGLVHETH